MDFLERHRLLFKVLAFVFIGLPVATLAIWNLFDKIKGANIVLPEVSASWFLLFMFIVGIILLMAIYIQGKRGKGDILPKSTRVKKELDLIIGAIVEAKKITRKGHEVKVYISSDTGLNAIYAQELKDILLKLQDDEKIITIKLFPDWLLPSTKFTKDVHDSRILAKLEPSRKHFIVNTLDSFDKWCADYMAGKIKQPKGEQDSNIVPTIPQDIGKSTLEDIKSCLITMNMYEIEAATKKAKRQCPENTAKQIHDDFFVIFDADAFISIIQKAIMNDIDPLIDFFKKFGDILDGNEYGLKGDLEDIELYKSSRRDLGQKRQKLHTTKERKAITQKNINRVRALTYGLNSSIILRGVLRSAPKTNGMVHPAIRIVLVGLESIEALVENSLAEMLDNLENEWEVNIDTTQVDTSQLQVLFELLSTLDKSK